jgi:aminopeptidase S
VRARGGVAIVYDGGTETYPLRPSLPGRITVPIFIARTSSVVALRRTRAPVRARADMVRERRTASNVIAELPGGPRIVMAGGHLDSVPEGPGVNDNGSGLAALLEVAGRLPSEPRRATVRLGFWTAEEYGLHGSRHYVAGLPRAERRRFAAYLNYDMVGSPNGLAEVYDSDDALEALQRRAFRGPVGETFLGGASDHQAFEQAGIPVNGVYTGALERRDGRLRDRCYHRACDGAANVNRDLAARVATAAERALAQLAAGGRGA